MICLTRYISLCSWHSRSLDGNSPRLSSSRVEVVSRVFAAVVEVSRLMKNEVIRLVRAVEAIVSVVEAAGVVVDITVAAVNRNLVSTVCNCSVHHEKRHSNLIHNN